MDKPHLKGARGSIYADFCVNLQLMVPCQEKHTNLLALTKTFAKRQQGSIHHQGMKQDLRVKDFCKSRSCDSYPMTLQLVSLGSTTSTK